jgi:hypothetical protein
MCSVNGLSIEDFLFGKVFCLLERHSFGLNNSLAFIALSKIKIGVAFGLQKLVKTVRVDVLYINFVLVVKSAAF